MALNNLRLVALAKSPRPGKYTDGQGLSLKITAAGGMYWQWRIRTPRENIVSYGIYPEVSLAEARERHRQAREQRRNGLDPNLEKRKAKLALIETIKQENTFEVVAREWFSKNKNGWAPAYAEQGRIHIDATYQKAIKDVATRHVENMKDVSQDKAVALAGTRQAVDHINEAVRTELKRAGQLAEGEKFTTQDEQRNIGAREIELAKGDRVLVGTTDTAKGYANGDTGRVMGMDAKTGTIEVKLDRTGETVKVNTQEAEVRHGYAMTTHKSQGSTYDRATVYLDSNTSREMAYVQASRAREQTEFVTTRYSVAEMRRDTPAPEVLQKAVEQVPAPQKVEIDIRMQLPGVLSNNPQDTRGALLAPTDT